MADEVFPSDRLWTIVDAARALHVSDDTARPLLAHLAIRLSSRCVRYDPSEVRQFLESLKTGRPARPVAPGATAGIDVVVVEAAA